MKRERYPYKNRQGLIVRDANHEAALDFARRSPFIRYVWLDRFKPFWQRLNSWKRK